MLLRVLVGVTWRPGPGPNSPRGAGEAAAAADAARNRRQGRPTRKRAGFFIQIQESVQIQVHIIGIMRRSQRRGRLSLITAADARDGRPKSCQGRTAAGEAADAAKKPAEKAGILPRVIIHRRNPAQPKTEPEKARRRRCRRSRAGQAADGVRRRRDGAEPETVRGGI